MLSVLGDESPTAELGEQQQEQPQAKVNWRQVTTSQSPHFIFMHDVMKTIHHLHVFFSFVNRCILISLFFKMIHVVHKVLH